MFFLSWLGFLKKFSLQIRALTKLCLFTEAVNVTVLLTQGAGVLLPYGHYITKACLQVCTWR